MAESYVLFSEEEVAKVVGGVDIPLNREALRKLANDTRRRMAEDNKSFPAARHEAMSNFPQRKLMDQERFKAYVSALGKLFNARKRFKKPRSTKPTELVPIDHKGQYLMRV